MANLLTEDELNRKLLICRNIVYAAKLIHKDNRVALQNEKHFGFISACIGIALSQAESGLMEKPVGSKTGNVDEDKPETVDIIMAFHQDVSWYFGSNALNVIVDTNGKSIGKIVKDKDGKPVDTEVLRVNLTKKLWDAKVVTAIGLSKQMRALPNDIDLLDRVACAGYFKEGSYDEFASSIEKETINSATYFFTRFDSSKRNKGFVNHISNLGSDYNDRDKKSKDEQYEFVKVNHFPKSIDDFNAKKNKPEYKPYCDIIVAVSQTQRWSGKSNATYDEFAAGFYKKLGGGASDSFFENIGTVSKWLHPKYADMNPNSSNLAMIYSYNKEATKNLKINPPQGIWKLFNLNFWNMAPDSPNGKADYFSNIELLQLMDISYASTIGSIKTFFRKIIQDPFVHGYGDSEGLMYNYNVRLKPFIEELWKCLPYYMIDKTNVISDQLTWETESYSWYRLIPVGNYFGPTTRAVDYLNSFFFSEYAKVFGNNVLDQTCNYVTYDISKNLGETVQQNSIFLLKYMIACHCYLPFTRRGEITINYNPEIKIGNRILNMPTKEMFYIDTVRHIQKFGDKPSEVTILGVSRGMDYEDDDYWNLINYNEKTSTKKVKVGVAVNWGVQDTHVEKVFYFNDEMSNLDIDFDSDIKINGKFLSRNNMGEYIAGVDKKVPFNLTVEYFCETFYESIQDPLNFNKTNGDYFNRLIKKNENRKFPRYNYKFQLKDTSKSLWSVGSPENAERFFLNSNFYLTIASYLRNMDRNCIVCAFQHTDGEYLETPYLPIILVFYLDSIDQSIKDENLINYTKKLYSKIDGDFTEVFSGVLGKDGDTQKVIWELKLDKLSEALEKHKSYINKNASFEFTEKIYKSDYFLSTNSFAGSSQKEVKLDLENLEDKETKSKLLFKDDFYLSFKSIMKHKRTGDPDLSSDSNRNKNSLHEVKTMLTRKFLSLNIFNEPSEQKRQEGIKQLKGILTIVSSVSSEGFNSDDSELKQGGLYSKRIESVKDKIVYLLNNWYETGGFDGKVSNVVKNPTNKKTLDYLLDYKNNKDNCIFKDAYDNSFGNYVVGKDIRKLSKEEMSKFINEADLVDDFQPINEQTTSYTLSKQFILQKPTNGQILKPFNKHFKVKNNYYDIIEPNDKYVTGDDNVFKNEYFDSNVTEKAALYMAALHHDFRSVRVFWSVEAKQWESSSDTKSGDVSEVEITTTNYDWHVNKDVFLRLLNKKHKKDGFANKITQKNSSNTQ